MSSSDSDDWWAAKDTDTDSGGQGQEDSAALADAAADLRYAAEVMRDAATPAAPEPEGNWDFTWITEMRKRSDNGWAFVTALWSFGPAWLLFLAMQRFEFWTATGITLIGFVFVGGWHLRVERKTTRLITWGLPVGLAYYAPVAIVFGLGKVLVGG
uniref:Integral membrane protein n=1 Tax=Streptomyces sp. NBC_00093 TaxID=2975649 RepID=A0AAU2AJY2_9ACTN